jgi:anti-anti-sigma factor
MEPHSKPEGLELRIQGGEITVAGELDLASVSLLTDAVSSVEGGDVVLDLDQVVFIDSSGIGAIVTAYQQLARDGRRLTVARCSDIVARVFEVSGIDKLLGLSAESE